MRFYTCQKQFACGIDLHAKSLYLCLIDQQRTVLVHRKVQNNDTALLQSILAPYLHRIVVAAESSFAWYWLADFCAQRQIDFILGHALYMKAIHGGKAKNDRIDSYKIALLTFSGMFPLAYVYPQAKRALRDLLRRRLRLVYQRSELLAHLKLLNYQENLVPLTRAALTITERPQIPAHFNDQHRQYSATTDLELAKYYDQTIKQLEQYILRSAQPHHSSALELLTNIKGIGPIISLTILLEIDTIDRFPSRQHFASYCRLVKCTRESADKKYGFSGVNIGNPYLKNIFCEAALSLAHHNPDIHRHLQKMQQRHGKGKGTMLLAHKFARAVYYMLKTQTPFDQNRFLSQIPSQATNQSEELEG